LLAPSISKAPKAPFQKNVLTESKSLNESDIAEGLASRILSSGRTFLKSFSLKIF